MHNRIKYSFKVFSLRSWTPSASLWFPRKNSFRALTGFFYKVTLTGFYKSPPWDFCGRINIPEKKHFQHICGLANTKNLHGNKLKVENQTAQNMYTDYTTWKAQRRWVSSGNQKEEAGLRLLRRRRRITITTQWGAATCQIQTSIHSPTSHRRKTSPREAQKLLPVRSRSARLSAPEPPPVGLS